MKHNPIQNLNLVHCELLMAVGMINTVIEATMCGECTLVDIGNSLSILKEYMNQKLNTLEEESRKLHGLSIWGKDTISDKEILNLYQEEKISFGKKGKIEKKVDTLYSQILQYVDMLPDEYEKPAWHSIREAGAASREQGFLQGFRKACLILENMEVI